MRVLVCGGRDYEDHATIAQEMEELALLAHAFKYDPITVVHGDARGADRNAAACAELMGLEVEAHPADWKANGRAAGPIRNKKMLNTGIDLVVAFPGGRGTEHMKSIARKAGVEVYEVEA